ncbi:MAG: Hpt domain-containing protein [Pseudomonadota bacterium]|nr:Hpt domain-containing protein [Pseudomonadota bacterium]
MSGRATVINVPNALKAKVGGGLAALNADAIAAAEAALKELAGNFSQWLDDEIVKLETARSAIRAQGLTLQTTEALYLRAHDLKGLGATYEFPLVSRIAGSLCKLIDDPQKRLTAPMVLVDAHIDAIKAAVRGDIRDEDHPVGRVLCAELESRVREHTDA